MAIEVDVNGPIRVDVARAESAADRAEAAATAAEAALADLQARVGYGIVIVEEPPEAGPLDTFTLDTSADILYRLDGVGYQLTLAVPDEGGGGGDEGGGEIPPGAVGVWYADQVNDDQPIPYIPNTLIAETTPIPVLINCPRGLFATSAVWNARANVTCVDNIATAPDGSLQASTLIGTGSWHLGRDQAVDGQNTIGISVKRKTSVSSDQSFQLALENGNLSGELIATNAWQRFIITHTFGSPQTVQCYIRDFGGANAQLEICDFYVMEGGADLAGLTPPVRPSHIFLGKGAGDDTVSVTGDLLDLSSGGGALAQFPTASDYAAITAIFLIEQVDDGNNFGSLLGTVGGATSFYYRFNDNPFRWQFAGDLGPVPAQPANSLRLNGEGVHAVTFRYDGASMDTFVDDALWIHKARTGLDGPVTTLWGLGALPTGFVADHKVNTLLLYNKALTNTEIRSGIVEAVSRMEGATALTVTKFPKVVYCEGDSITAPYLGASAEPAYPSLIGEACSPDAQLAVWAIAGDKLVNMNARATALDGAFPLALGSRTYILTVLIGANDLAAYTGGAAQYITDLQAYCDARRTAGWKVVLLTILPKTTDPDTGIIDAEHNTRRALVNTAITTGGDFDGHCDGVADIAASILIGRDTDCLNPTYYIDGIHPTTAGQAVISGLVVTQIDAL